MKLTIQTTIINGKATRNLNLLRDAFASFEGKNVNVTIEPVKKKRSNEQNRYLWGVCYPIIRNCLKELGNNFSDNDVHDLLKMKFLKQTVLANEETGECIERVKSTTELSTVDFMTYVMEIQKFSEEWFGVIIPDSNTQLTIG
jgi:hypothetical protein